MITRTASLVVLAAIAALAAACGSPDTPREQGRAADDRRVAETRYADQNRDGKVTREEAKADPYLAASFDRFDSDQNETLDRAEFARLEAASLEPDQAEDDAAAADQRHQLRPRREFPRPED